MYAVFPDSPNSIFFLTGRPEGNRWRVEEGVEIDVPDNIYDWPPGTERPAQVLCRSLANPKHFKLFKYPQDMNPSEFQPTDKSFGGIYATETWERFMKKLLPALDQPDAPDNDPPGAWEEATRPYREPQ